jgi:predicted  nucleic acid-binding Zn-ribbon protein
MADDIINQLLHFVHNEERMPAGLVRTVVEEIEWLREQAATWQATAAGLAQDISNAEDEVERLSEKQQDLRMYLEQDACEIERLRECVQHAIDHVGKWQLFTAEEKQKILAEYEQAVRSG